MAILERLRNRPPREDRDNGSPEAAAAANGHQAPIPGYDNLNVKKLGERLTDLSQAELAAVETYERSHEDRPEVLARLRYLRGDEPLPGYDALDSDGVGRALAGADRQTVKAVRDYERKFRRRHDVLEAVARVLPDAEANAGEVRAREQQTALVRKGFAGRAKTADGLSSDRSARDAGENVPGLDG
jgi:hypothetical protein